MSRILMVSPVPTHPTTAGNRARLCSLRTALEDGGHSVYFLHVERESGDSGAMEAYWGDNYLQFNYREPKTSIRRFVRRARRRLGLISAHKYSLDEWYDDSLTAVITDTIDSLQIDALYVHYVFFSKALTAAPMNVLRLLDTHDAFGDRHLKYIQSGLAPNWFSCSVNDEARGIKRADVVIAIQDQEARYFASLTDNRVITVGHTVELTKSIDPYPDNAVILTVGSSNPINQDSVRWFIDNVLPKIRLEIPHATLKVAGSVCDALSSSPGIELLGRVDDLNDVYQSAQVVVNPMQLGTGLKIKSIEALGQGRALVTTAAGAEGLNAGSGTAFLEASSIDEFASAAAGLLLNPDSASNLASAGLAYARQYNETCLTPLENALAHGVSS